MFNSATVEPGVQTDFDILFCQLALCDGINGTGALRIVKASRKINGDFQFSQAFGSVCGAFFMSLFSSWKNATNSSSR